MIYLVGLGPYSEIGSPAVIERVLPANAQIFMPYHYAWSTGLAHTCFDEVWLCLSGDYSQRDLPSAVEEHLDKFGLRPYRNMPVDALSGGWSKLLPLSIFTATLDCNRPAVIYNLTQYLDDSLIAKVFDSLESTGGDIYVCDLDPPLLGPLFSRMTLLLPEVDDGAILLSDPKFAPFRAISRIRLPGSSQDNLRL
jgi:hypothetical protein